MKYNTLKPINELNDKYYLNEVSLDLRRKLTKLNKISEEMGYSNKKVVTNLFIRLATSKARNIDPDIILANEILNKNKTIHRQKRNEEFNSNRSDKDNSICSKLQKLPSIKRERNRYGGSKDSNDLSVENNQEIESNLSLNENLVGLLKNKTKEPRNSVRISSVQKKNDRKNPNEVSNKILHDIFDRIKNTSDNGQFRENNEHVDNKSGEEEEFESEAKCNIIKSQDKELIDTIPSAKAKISQDKSLLQEYQKIFYGDNRVELIKNHLFSSTEDACKNIKKKISHLIHMKTLDYQPLKSKIVVDLSNLVDDINYNDYFNKEETLPNIKKRFIKQQTQKKILNIFKLPTIKQKTIDSEIPEKQVVQQKLKRKERKINRKIKTEENFKESYEEHKKQLIKLKEKMELIFKNIQF